jgi:hypothetical protein
MFIPLGNYLMDIELGNGKRKVQKREWERISSDCVNI